MSNEKLKPLLEIPKPENGRPLDESFKTQLPPIPNEPKPTDKE